MILEKGKIQQNQSFVVRLRLRKQPSVTERSQLPAWSDRGILPARFKNRFSCPNLASQPGREPLCAVRHRVETQRASLAEGPRQATSHR
jgi:hypothetical protein